MSMESPSNPFATRFIKAGSLPFVFSDGQSLSELRHRLTESNWRGQIIGPHGSGKSTLLRTLEPSWASWGRRSFSLKIDANSRSFPALSKSDWSYVDTLVVDGYEQLGFFTRMRLLLKCYGKRKGLVVTTHQRVFGLPIVFATSTNESLAVQLTETLLEASDVSNSKELLNRVPFHFQNHSGNVREMFLSLYDEVAQ